MREPENAPGRGCTRGTGKELPPAHSKADDAESVHQELHGLQPLLKARAVQALLGVSPRTLWSMTASGELPSVRLRRAVRYRIEDVQELIHQNFRGRTS